METNEPRGVASVCPYNAQNTWKCRHCPPEDAPCAKVCPKGAVYEAVEGILAIDHSLCDGCGLCAEACPYGAIIIKNGKAVKCDLCVLAGGEPLCVAAGFAHVVYSTKEMDEMGKAMGWLVLRNGELSVDVEPPRLWEAKLVKIVVDRYEKLRGRFSWEEILEGLEYDIGEIPKDVKKRVLWWIRLTYEELGPLSFLDREDFEEIAVNGLKKPIMVYVRGKGWVRTNLAFWTEEYFISIVNRIASGVCRRLTKANARITAVLSDGSRLHAIIPPLSTSGHSLTIRRFSVRPFTPYDLMVLKTAEPKTLALVWLFLDEEKNIVIAGNTGSGKTTTLNAIMAFVPLEERIIIVEETPEIRIPHEHVVRLIPDGNTSMQELVYDTLRMRPDRVIVGEVRRPEEMRALFDTMLAGQGRGSYATMHGKSVGEAVQRIRSMNIPPEDLITLDLILVQKRRRRKNREERRIVEVGVRGDRADKERLAKVLDIGIKELERCLRKRVEILKKIKERDLRRYAEEVERWRERL